MKTEMDFHLRCLVADLFPPKTFTEVKALTRMDNIPIELNQGNKFDVNDPRSRQRMRYPGGTYKTTLRVRFNLGERAQSYDPRDARVGDVIVHVVNVDCPARCGIDYLRLGSGIVAIVFDKRMPGKRHPIWKKLVNVMRGKNMREKYAANHDKGNFIVEFDRNRDQWIYASKFEDTQSVRDRTFFPSFVTAACCLRRVFGRDVSRLILHYLRYMRRDWPVSHTPSVLLKPREPKIQT